MNKKIFFVVSLVVILGIVGFFIFKNSNNPLMVRSDDGNATLEIPKSAMPENLDKDDISITLNTEVLGDGIYSVYELMPEGLKFSEPVIFKTSVPASDTIPLLAHYSKENSLELIEDAQVSINEDETIIEASINHFSTLVAHEGPFTLKHTPESVRRFVGNSFTASVDIESEGSFGDDNTEDIKESIKAGELSGYAEGLNGVPVAGPTQYDIMGYFVEITSTIISEGWTTNFSGILSPEISESVEGEKFENTYSNSATFTCERPGKETVTFSAEFLVLGREHHYVHGSYTTPPEGELYRENMYASFIVPVECIARGSDVSDSSLGQAEEASDDCFVPKQGDVECEVDAIGVSVERVAAEGECKAVRATIDTNINLPGLGRGDKGEMVMQVHRAGSSSDGSSDTGIGIGNYGAGWNEFKYGPGNTPPPPDSSSIKLEGKTATLQLNSFADGSCINEDDQLRIKFEMTNNAGQRVYDVVGQPSGALMDYLPVSAYTK
ncbi:MAG: hypothetical protein R3251_00915 [Candidatus Spechtbacterales bacterium]|nr:hypothetical protein [Candidatus Spechtbacterales bacterium]